MRLDEARWRVVLSMSTPPLLVAMAWGADLVGAPVFLTLALAALAALLGYVALFDYAKAISIDDTGIERLCILRRQRTPWEDVAGITRPRNRGLVLVTSSGKRRILLDRRLDDQELALLRAQPRMKSIKSDL